MNSRWSAEENLRAAKVSYIPGGESLKIPDNELGKGSWISVSTMAKQPPRPMYFADSPSVAVLPGYMKVASKPTTVAYVPTYDNIPGIDAAFMNQRVVSKRKSYLPNDQFNIFRSELYPQPLPMWSMSVGDPARFDGR